MNFRLVFCMFLILISITGCGAGSARLTNAQGGLPGEDIDPFTFGDEFTSKVADSKTSVPASDPDGQTQPVEMPVQQSQPVSRPAKPLPDGSSATTVYGYRVQIGLFEDREQMERMADSARSVQNMPVYVEYEAPFYRVRVGDFTSREDAENYVRFLKQKGFGDALWVMSKIQLQ